jgi:hypothetical protein
VDAYMCYSDDFIQKLACLIDVFEKLRNLWRNKCKVLKLILWRSLIVTAFMKNCNCWKETFFDMFLTYGRCPSSDTEANKKYFINHVNALQKQFSLYFRDVDVSNLNELQTHLPLTMSPD